MMVNNLDGGRVFAVEAGLYLLTLRTVDKTQGTLLSGAFPQTITF